MNPSTNEEQQRAMIRSAFLDGASYPELAEREGVPLGTAKTRIRTGLRRLRAAGGLGCEPDAVRQVSDKLNLAAALQARLRSWSQEQGVTFSCEHGRVESHEVRFRSQAVETQVGAQCVEQEPWVLRSTGS